MTDPCSNPSFLSFEQAKQALLTSVTPISDVELINIEDADKRILATDIVSPMNVPAHNNSAMDGYALRDDLLASGEQELNQFELVGSAFAGAPFKGELQNGQCIRIMTGAIVPEGANSVVMQEQVTDIHNDIGATIELTQPTKPQNNIRFAGEDIQQNTSVFKTGYQLKAVDLGLLASLGISQIQVFRKLKIALLSTGNELKHPSQTLSEGDIYESNSHVLNAMIKRMGFDVLPLGIIPDSPEQIEQAFNTANKEADVVISTGGVSVGEADYTKEVLEQLGQVDFWKVAIKPGKPFAFGHLSESTFFGLPGNPVSAAVTFHQLTKPTLLMLSGAKPSVPLILSATLTQKIRKKAGRMDFQRGIASINEQGQLQVTPLSAQGSGILSSISKANCYIILAAENTGLEVGELAQIELFDDVIG